MGSPDFKVAFGLFAASFLLFASISAHQNLDSRYSLLVSDRLISTGVFHVDGIPGLTIPDPTLTETGTPARIPEVFVRVDGRYFYFYPPGTSILTAPIVGVLRIFGFGISDEQGRYQRKTEGIVQSFIASFLMAALASIFFLAARYRLPPSQSLWIAAGATFGSQLWSTASRALWSHTWGIFLVGGVVWMLFRDADRKQPRNPILMATLLSWAFFCRPTFAIPIAGVSLMLCVTRKIQLHFAITGALWLLGFFAFSQFHYGEWLPPYYLRDQLNSPHLFEALLGSLVSPSRGLLIYVPIVLIPLFAVARNKRFLRHHELAWLAGGVIFLHALTIAKSALWWGGHSYGPRLATDMVPWFVALAILGFDAARRAAGSANSSGFSICQRRIAGALLAISVLMNGQAGLASSPMKWNNHPIVPGQSIDDRLWDWRHPQFLHGIQSKDHGFREELFD
jgi:hypothetical protein